MNVEPSRVRTEKPACSGDSSDAECSRTSEKTGGQPGDQAEPHCSASSQGGCTNTPVSPAGADPARTGESERGETAITTEATRSPTGPVRPGFTSDKTLRTTRKPFTAFNNLNIPIKSPQRFQQVKTSRNRTRTAPRIPTVKQKKIEKTRKSKLKKQIKNKNKERKPKQVEDDRKSDDVKGDFDEDYEPTPEPEPTGGHRGDPRHHAFHSCQYID